MNNKQPELAHLDVVSCKRNFITRKIKGLENISLIIILFALIVVMAFLTGGRSISILNIKNILETGAIRGVAAVGMTFVLLTGGIDLAVGGVAVFAACVGGLLISSGHLSLPLTLGIFIMLSLGTFVGALNGLFVSRLRVAPLISTLSTWQITYGIAYWLTKGGTLVGFPDALGFLGRGELLGIPVPIFLFGITALCGHFVLTSTAFGRSIYAVGGEENSAWLAGIMTKAVKFWVYVVSGLLASVAGIIAISRVMCASVKVVYGLELEVIAATVIGGVSLFGGRGNILGAVIGTLIIGVLKNGLNLVGANPNVQNIATGLVIFAAVVADIWLRREQ